MNFKKLFFENLTSKIFSILVAIILWLFVMGEKKAEVELKIPLEIVGIPPNTIVVNDIPSSLEVKVMGPRTLLRNLSDRVIKRAIDLTKTEEGWTTFRILPDSIYFPRGVEVTRLSPSSVDVKLEAVVQGRFPVKVVLKGKPADGYRLIGAISNPKVISLKGARSDLRKLKEVTAGPIDISNMKETLIKEVPLDFSALHLTEKSSEKANVTVKIEPAMIERVFEKIPVKVINNESSYRLSSPFVEVVLYGPKQRLLALKKKDIEIKVDLKGLDPGSYRRQLMAKLPSGIVLQAIKPEWLDVEIEK